MPPSEPTKPSLPTIKRLFAKSGDRCAFPGCAVHVVQGITIVADICHIKAASPFGPRYDPTQTATERHAFENLILLCANHHRIIDDDPDSYPVDGLQRMKRAHEDRATALTPEVVEQASELLAARAAAIDATEAIGESMAQSTTTEMDRAQRQTAMGRAASLHRERLAKIVTGNGQVPIMDGGLFVFHIVPVESLDIQQSLTFSDIAANPDRFPPIAAARPRDWKVDFDGLLTGSNADGLSKPQRAYTHIFRSGVVETVASSLARGREHNFLMLPQIQAMLIKYVAVYMRSLNSCGIKPPALICASLAGVENMRLLTDFISTSLPEDIPGPRLDRAEYNFAETFLDAVPVGIVDCAKRLKPTLDHLANAAGLTVSPYFDADGNYTLTP